MPDKTKTLVDAVVALDNTMLLTLSFITSTRNVTLYVKPAVNLYGLILNFVGSMELEANVFVGLVGSCTVHVYFKMLDCEHCVNAAVPTRVITVLALVLTNDGPWILATGRLISSEMVTEDVPEADPFKKFNSVAVIEYLVFSKRSLGTSAVLELMS